MKTLSLHEKNLEIAFEEEGEGLPVFFVHGLAESSLVWKYAIAELKKNFRCIRIDLPGHGNSWEQRGSFTMSFYSDVVLACLDALSISEVVLAGHSMGAQISLITALRAPARVQKLVLASPAGFETFTAEEKEGLIKWTEQAYSQPSPVSQLQFYFRQQLRRHLEQAEELIAHQSRQHAPDRFDRWRETLIKSVTGMLREPVSAFLPEISTPTLVLYGAHDNLIPNRYLHPQLTTEQVAHQGTALLPHADFKMIPDCGHYLPFEQPEVFAKEVKRFLS
jgi:pimeloyl-ACP methyl ester carboxylesterase